MLFHCNNVYANAFQCSVIRTQPVLYHLLLRLAMSFFPLGKSKYAKLGNNFQAMLMLTDFSWFTTESNRDCLRSCYWIFGMPSQLSDCQLTKHVFVPYNDHWFVNRFWKTCGNFFYTFCRGMSLRKPQDSERPLESLPRPGSVWLISHCFLVWVSPTFVSTQQTRPTRVSERFLWNSALATASYAGESSEGDMSLWQRWCWRPKPSGM
jgi:hypothetical protein